METELIQIIRRLAQSHPRIELGIGDDAAVLSLPSNRELLVTTDMLMDGTDFIVAETTPELIGRKAIGVNLSDIAAMGGEPTAAFVSLAIDRRLGDGFAARMMESMVNSARQFGVEIAGGDTNVWNEGLVINVTMLGESPRGKSWKRNGARKGDRLIVTGPCGGSILERHLRVTPRFDVVEKLVGLDVVHAAVDISDGLAKDAYRIATESGLGMELVAHAIPIHRDAETLSNKQGDTRSPLEHALHDGEDFELVLAVAPTAVQQVLELIPSAREIGELLAEREAWLLDSDDERKPLSTYGFEHA